jgi:hypothetical protein
MIEVGLRIADVSARAEPAKMLKRRQILAKAGLERMAGLLVAASVPAGNDNLLLLIRQPAANPTAAAENAEKATTALVKSGPHK